MQRLASRNDRSPVLNAVRKVTPHHAAASARETTPANSKLTAIVALRGSITCGTSRHAYVPRPNRSSASVRSAIKRGSLRWRG